MCVQLKEKYTIFSKQILSWTSVYITYRETTHLGHSGIGVKIEGLPKFELLLSWISLHQGTSFYSLSLKF